jgi:hypothetical protein
MAACPARHVSDCVCPLDRVWEGSAGLIKVYMQSKLMAYGRLLLHIPGRPGVLFGAHRVPMTTGFALRRWEDDQYLTFTMRGNNGRMWGLCCYMDSSAAGLSRIRAIQCWWRRLSTAKWQERALAVAMGMHERLGAESEMMRIDTELVRSIVQTRV